MHSGKAASMNALRARVPRAVMLSVLVALIVLPIGGAAGYKAWRWYRNRLKAAPMVDEAGIALSVGASPAMPPPIVRTDVPEMQISEVARDLQIVWSLRWSADGRLFITERRGRILVLRPGASVPELYANVSTALGSENGLLGLALHPRFPQEPFVYVMYTAHKAGGGVNRVSRLVDSAGRGTAESVVLDDIPAARSHNGGALEFGPDGMLYVGTGDVLVPALAQDLHQWSGKILRIHPDGSVPGDNPLPGSPIWAYGFRNVSGLAFHPLTGELWAASHGPSAVGPGEPKHMDSIYIVRKGGNHGWPWHLGVSIDPAIVSPVVFHPERSVPPGGLAFHGGDDPLRQTLFLTSLRGHIERLVIANGREISRIEQWWPDRFGRVRAVTVGPGGSVYVGTSNHDGRADREYPGSDFIYKLSPVSLAPGPAAR